MSEPLIRLVDWLRENGIRRGAVVHPLARGELVTYRLGRSIYLDRANADAWLRACRRPVPASPQPPPMAA